MPPKKTPASLELISEFSKVTGLQDKHTKILVFLCIYDEPVGNKIENIISFIITQKIPVRFINLTKHVQVSYAVNSYTFSAIGSGVIEQP